MQINPESTPEVREQQTTSQHLRAIVGTVAIVGVIFVLLSTSFRNFQVDGSSMHPNVQSGQFLVVNKAAYRDVSLRSWGGWIPFVDRDGDGHAVPFGEPRRGDVIVLKDPSKPERNLIKRVIGLPGETVEVRAGVVYINGLMLDEDYLVYRDSRTVARTTVPARGYYVMGDERIDSLDSRIIGTIPRENIIGKAWITYWPAGRLGIVQNLGPRLAAS